MADGGLRRPEAAALTWGDVEFWPNGTARITIQKGKNQPEPATVAVTETTACALSDIQPEGTDPPPRRSRTKAAGSTAIWWPGTPGARPGARPSSG